MTKIIDAIEMTKINTLIHKSDVNKIEGVLGEKPKFVIINASDNPSNERYINGKIEAGYSRGLEVQNINLPESCTNDDIIDIIDECNKQKIPMILQLPTYDHINNKLLIDKIHRNVDADGFTKEWLGELALGREEIVPATPKGVINLLDYHEVNMRGKVVVVIGRSNHVGKPLCMMFINRGATVISANSLTTDLKSWLKQADIIVSCVGRVELIQPEDIKEGSVLIGVGFSYVGRKQVLDFDLDAMVESNKPVLVSNRINCTGKATINALIDNVIQLYKINFDID